jgi:ABC-type Mn2+/Zn2+ transport system permease subunit
VNPWTFTWVSPLIGAAVGAITSRRKAREDTILSALFGAMLAFVVGVLLSLTWVANSDCAFDGWQGRTCKPVVPSVAK